MKRNTIFLLLIIALFLLGFPENNLFAQKLDFTTELNRLYDIKLLPRYIDKSMVKQFSSYDRTGGNNDGFEGTYSYIRKNEDSSLVVFEVEGKGVIERIWTPTPTNDTLDFYLDGSKSPDFSINFNDLFSGKVYPFIPPLVGQHIVGGYYSYLPIPYNNGCKIVFRGEKMLFYQFQYREYNNDDYRVQNFNPMHINAEEERELNKLVKLWNYENRNVESFYGNDINVIPSVFQLKPGQSFTIADIKEGGRILGIEIDPADIFEGMYKQIDLKITWDDEKTPAIYTPVADMFGYAFGTRSMHSLLMGVNYANKAYCYIPMPFDKAAKIELVYRGGISERKPVNIHSRVFYNNQPRVAGEEGKFYINWKREEPSLGKPYVFLEGKGKGHYIGTLLQSQATDYITFTEFFEGDDVTMIDGEMTVHGTGSEDYFNGGWYAQPGGWVGRLGTQLHGCLDYSLPLSRTGGYRFFILDKMRFDQSIHHSMEHGPENNNREVDYISVAMYYSDGPIQQSMTPTNALTKVVVPTTYTFYSRLMDHLSYEKDLALINGIAEYNGTDAKMTINVKEIPAGKYKVYINPIMDLQDEMQLGTKQGETIEWSRISNLKKFDPYLATTIEVMETKEPVEIFLKSSKKIILQFNRVMLEQ